MKNLTDWRFTYDVNKYVRDGEPENFKEIAQKIVDDLNGKQGFRNELAKQLLTNMLACANFEDFDNAWNDLYNYADRNKIWLGI